MLHWGKNRKIDAHKPRPVQRSERANDKFDIRDFHLQQERKMPYTLASFNQMLSRILCVSPQALTSLACGR